MKHDWKTEEYKQMVINWGKLSKTYLFRFFLSSLCNISSLQVHIGQDTCCMRIFRGEGRKKIKE